MRWSSSTPSWSTRTPCRPCSPIQAASWQARSPGRSSRSTRCCARGSPGGAAHHTAAGYTAADFYVSEETARAIDEQSRPESTDSNYRSQRGMFERWCAEMGRVAVPCTTATYIEYIAALIARGKYSPNTLKAHKSAAAPFSPRTPSRARPWSTA
ncbi:hypothetical protein SY2F82_72240 [Streptomyces sp. Y2F8-2]|nr:hypothetical protein SY2F82_72240 [Streptomyces sp. Y2F8-2]